MAKLKCQKLSKNREIKMLREFHAVKISCLKVLDITVVNNLMFNDHFFTHICMKARRKLTALTTVR